MVVIESIASGTPALVFNVGGCPEIIEDGKNGYVIPAFDVALFAQKAIGLLQNPQLLNTFAKNGEQIAAQKFSLGLMAHDYLAFCSKMLKQYGKNID
jgi:glycosyltransferase involved in cell wall biosynthesis